MASKCFITVRRLIVVNTLSCLAICVGHVAAAQDTECSVSSVDDAIRNGTLRKQSDDPVTNSVILNERILLIKEFGLSPTFYFMSGSGASKACAIPENIDPTHIKGGAIAFGLSLLEKEVSAAGGYQNVLSVPAIMAHEFAHILQYRNDSVLVGVQFELQADYLAGWYMGRRAKVVSSPGGSKRILSEVIKTFYAKGDYDFNDPEHHGTPEERMEAVSEGFKTSDLLLTQAYARSLQYIAEKYPTGGPSPINPNEFEAALRDIIKQSSNKFADLHGDLRSDHQHTWIAKKILPTALRCEVEWKNDYQGDYNCVMARNMDEAAIRDAWSNLAELVHKRFPDWPVETRPDVKEFHSPNSGDLTIDVRTVKSVVTGRQLEVEVAYDDY
jgi:hypothetical protein